MKLHTTKLPLLMFALLMIGSLSVSAQKIPFQGKLLDNGTPVEGPTEMTFSIDVDGTVWTESYTGAESVLVTNGLYSVILGSKTPLPENIFDGVDSRQLVVLVAGQALTPVDIYAPIESTRIYSDIDQGDDPFAFVIQQNISSNNTGVSNGARVFVQGQGSGTGDPTALRADAEAFNTLYNTGLWGRALGDGNNTPNSYNYGVYGEARNNTTNNYGTSGIAIGGSKSVGIYGTASGGTTENWAGLFEGDAKITGDLTVDGTLNANISLEGVNEFSTTYDPNDANALPALRAFADGTPLGYNDGGTPNDPSDDLNVQAVAIRGTSESNGYNIGVEGIANHTVGNGEFQVGVYGRAGGDGEGVKYGLRGDLSGSNSSLTVAVRGLNSSDATLNENGAGSSMGGWFDTRGTGIAGGSNYGVRGNASKNAGRNIGVYGAAQNGDSNYAGWFDGDVQINANQMGLGKKDWEPNPERPYFALRGTTEETDTNNPDCDDPNTPETEFCTFFPDLIWMDVQDDGEGNEIGVMHLRSTDGKDFRLDANGIGSSNLNGSSLSDDGILGGQSLGEFFVGNDPNGNDPSGASGAIQMYGTNTLNTRLMGQFWENADRPVLDLYGSHTDGGTWYWANAVLDVQGDATNDWGSLTLYKSAEGAGNHQQMIRLEGSDGSGHFAGDLTVDGNINGNINPDFSNLDVTDNGASASIYITNDPNNNDPTGYSAEMFLWGDESPNIQLGGQPWENGDLANLNLYGSNPEGTWYYGVMNMGAGRDGNTGEEWGALSISKNDGSTSSEMISLDGLSGNGYFAGDLNVDGNINGNFNVNLEGSSLSREDILDGQNMGSFYISNNPNGNDPGGASGQLELSGTNTPNFQLKGKEWDSQDRPILEMYGSHTDGNNWYWQNAILEVEGDATNDWGTLTLYKSAEGTGNHQQMIRLDASNGSGSFTGGLLNIGRGNDAQFGDFSSLRLDNTDTDAHIEFDGTGWMVLRGEDGNDKARFDNNGNGYIAGELTVDGNLNGNINAPQVFLGTDTDGGQDYGRLGLYPNDGATENISLNGGDGSAQFSGNISINGDGYEAISLQDGPDGGEIFVSNSAGDSWAHFQSANKQVVFSDGDLYSTVDTGGIFGGNAANGASWGTDSQNGNIDASNNISAGNDMFAVAFNTTSDRRLKTNILPLNNALDKVLSMRGVSYNWLDKDKSQANQIGVIAQEVEGVYPEFVHTNEDGMKSVNYSQMVAVLIEAIKELNTKITTLETENASLKASLAEVDGLKSQMKNLETLVAKLVSNETVTTTTQQQ